MKLSIITGGLLAVMAVSSCSSLSHTAQTADVDSRVYNLTVADMDVSENRATKTTVGTERKCYGRTAQGT